MDRDLIYSQLGRTIQQTDFTGLGTRYQGKVRDTYRTAEHLVLITTDRISAFDHILRQTIPFKGQVLNQIAAYFFELTAAQIPNHVLSVPDPNVTVARPCTTVPIEFVVRGYLAGHAWREYKSGKRTLCGKPLPEGLKQNDRFPTPLLTPATKAASGHDEDVSRGEILERGLLDEATFDYLESMALTLFRLGTETAAARGLILVDTKYEFGQTATGEYVLIDEIHTPDSSRYFYADTYDELLARDEPQRQLSKEFVREWLMEHGFQGKQGQTLPDLTDDFRVQVASRYIELYESLTGKTFVPDTHPDPLSRIQEALAGLTVDLS